MFQQSGFEQRSVMTATSRMAYETNTGSPWENITSPSTDKETLGFCTASVKDLLPISSQKFIQDLLVNTASLHLT